MKSTIATALACLICAGAAGASDNAALVAFAKANADKFRREIPADAPIAVGSKVALAGQLSATDMITLLPDYDQDAGRVLFGSPLQTVINLCIAGDCKQTGSFYGQNAFGIKAKVRVQKCESIFVQNDDPSGVKLWGSQIKLSPSQYREIKRSGVRVEIVFTIGANSAGVPVEVLESEDTPTVDLPVQSRTKTWRIAGHIDEIKWLLPGDSQPTLVWARQP